MTIRRRIPNRVPINDKKWPPRRRPMKELAIKLLSNFSVANRHDVEVGADARAAKNVSIVVGPSSRARAATRNGSAPEACLGRIAIGNAQSRKGSARGKTARLGLPSDENNAPTALIGRNSHDPPRGSAGRKTVRCRKATQTRLNGF